MNKLDVNLENCFGIGSLTHCFNFTKSNVSLIYAPNGTMKTSFAKTMDLISKNDPKNVPKDRVYGERITKYQVLVDGNSINTNNILVINSDDSNFDSSQKISTFLASKELKKRYDDIYTELNKNKINFIKKLKNVSQSNDCEKELVDTFLQIDDKKFFETLLSLNSSLKENFIKIDFKYNDVFDSKGKVLLFLEKNKKLLDAYINSYKNVVSKSKFFKETDGSTFGTYQANEVQKSISDNSFFKAGHIFVLDDKTVIDDSDKLRKLVDSELEKILDDLELKTSFEKVDKAITSNVELRAFHNVIKKNPLILLKLNNYQDFKEEVWVSFLSEIKVDTQLLIDLYAENKKELEKIIFEAKAESSLWIKIVDTFNSRFFVPFKVSLGNQDDVILKEQTASLVFEYSDRSEEPVKQDKTNLLSILSRGEKRAYFILQFLFELESRKLNSETNLLILDDISESFDYKNKFAIIEYISDIMGLENFRTIILTHNFDFYRTVSSRFSLDKSAVYIALKNENKQIFLKNGNSLRNIFPSIIKNFKEPKAFISLIAFVRNLTEYTEPKNSENYNTLTKCLHFKDDSSTLDVNDIFDIYKEKLSALKDESIDFGNEKIVNLIYKTSDLIVQSSEINEIELENKIVLAIAIRLRAEAYMLERLQPLNLEIRLNSNQTRVLHGQYRKAYKESEALGILDKVNLMTPENIHINAFMYEPLIDMSVYHLVGLYREVSNLS